MRTWITLFSVLILCLIPVKISAQSQVAISSMELDIWPEYDRPNVLIIYHIFLSEDTPLPAKMTLRVPAASGDPFNVAVRETDDQLYNLAYERTLEGDWASIDFSATAREIQFEYYDPNLVKSDQERSYVYTWHESYPITSLTVQVQQPVNAEAMQITPNLGTNIVGQGDLKYYQAMFGSVAADTDFTVSLGYQKSDDQLSFESLKIESASPISTDTTGRMNANQFVPWVLGILGGLLIVGGGLWYWQSDKAELRQKRNRHSRKITAESPNDSDTVYCHQCGKRASVDDYFCRACGAKLRKE